MSPQVDRDLTSLIRRAKMKFVDQAKEDLVNVLNNFKDLKPDISNFNFGDGINKNCLSLTGTIPINYKVCFIIIIIFLIIVRAGIITFQLFSTFMKIILMSALFVL
jgi:hypothetical protein